MACFVYGVGKGIPNRSVASLAFGVNVKQWDHAACSTTVGGTSVGKTSSWRLEGSACTAKEKRHASEEENARKSGGGPFLEVSVGVYSVL